MSGPGDIDGEVSDDEAAWRDLIARFDVQAEPTGAETPWPAREDLPERVTSAAEPSPAAAEQTARAETVAGTGEQSARAESAPGPAEPTASAADPVVAPETPSSPVTSIYLPTDRIRVIRPAGDPRSYTPAEEEDESYKPAPLPPPAKLDSTSKAALAGVIGGPGYLLVASVFLHWTVSAEAAFIAVAAFVAGFVTLIVKLGDRSGRDDDDDGAVL
jgi:hypothetical protein